MITRIQAAALKGRTFSQALQPLAVIAGPNDSGKTAIIDAIKIALLGHLPGHAKTAKGIFALSSASNMSVVADLPTGPVTRSWHTKGKTISSTEAGISTLPAFPLAMLDGDAYFGASDQARTAMVFGLVDLTRLGFDPETMAAEVSADINDATAAMKIATMLREAEELHGKMTPQVWIDTVLEALAEELKLTAAEIKRMEGTGQGLAQLGQNDQMLEAGRIAREIAAVTERGIATQKEAGAIAGQLEQIQGPELEALRVEEASLHEELHEVAIPPLPRAEIEQAIEQARGKCMDLVARLKEAERTLEIRQQAKARMEEITKELLKLPMPQPAELERQRQALVVEIEAAGKTHDTQTTEAAMMEAKGNLSGLRAQYEAVDKQRAAAAKKWVELARKGCCPTCGIAGEDFEMAIAQLEAQELSQLDQEKGQIEREGHQAKKAYDKAEAAHTDTCKRKTAREALQTRWDALERAIEADGRLERDRQIEIRESQGHQAMLAEPEPSMTELTEEHRTAIHAFWALQAQGIVRAKHERLEELTRMLKAAGAVDAKALEQRQAEVAQTIQDLNATMMTLRQQEKQATAQAADARRAAQAQEEKAAKTAQAQVLKAKVELLKDKREELVKAAFRPLLEVANRFTAEILPTKLELRDGEIGRWQAATWISVKAFGGCHGAVTFAGIQAALAAQAGCRLVIVDELGRFDDQSLERFLENTAAAIKAGVIEQFLGTDVNPARYRDRTSGIRNLGLQLIETGEK